MSQGDVDADAGLKTGSSNRNAGIYAPWRAEIEGRRSIPLLWEEVELKGRGAQYHDEIHGSPRFKHGETSLVLAPKNEKTIL